MNEQTPYQSQIPPPPAPQAPAPPPIAAPIVVPMVEKKSPGLAGLLSIFPGVGHLYLGLYSRALAFAGAFIFCIWMADRAGEFFGPLIAFVWFFGLIDAVRQAKAINLGQVAEGGFAPEKQIRRAASGTGALTWGVILVGLGSLWLIDRYVEIDWSFMEDWGGPLALIVLGFVLIVTHVMRKRRENESGAGMPPRSE